MNFIILDSAVVRTSLLQTLDSPGKSEKSLITKKVTSTFPGSPDKPICYAINACPTAESRMIGGSRFEIFLINYT
ncbi:MAG: hypothetical protein HQL70_12005 [Magnetococcales bacterium]|nr:hypothetical protein [Magnetococcales bacterium]